MQIYRVGLWLLCTAFPLIAIYPFTKFDLNGNSSFKVICRTSFCDGWTDRQSGDYMLPPSWSIKIVHVLLYDEKL